MPAQEAEERNEGKTKPVNTTNLRSNKDVIRETYVPVEQMTHPELTVRVMSLRVE
jgi:hypothetical protein